MGVADVLDQVEPGIRPILEAPGRQVAPIGAGDEQQVPFARLPVGHPFLVGSGPELLALTLERGVPSDLGEGDPAFESRQSGDVFEIVGVLDVAALETLVLAMEPDGPGRRGFAHVPSPRIASAARSQSAAA